MPNLVNDFEVRKETLRALGGNPDGLANIYEVDLEILKLTGGSGSGAASHDSVDGVNYLTFVAIEDSTIKITKSFNGSYGTYTFEYSTDNAATWNSYTIDTEISLKSGENVKFRGNNPNGLAKWGDFWLDLGPSGYHRFDMTGKISAYGSIMSLLSPTLNITKTPSAAFCYLFNNCTSLIKSPELPATETNDFCYCGLFNGCTNLAIAPELPSTRLYHRCYMSMFSGCTSLVESPVLPATELGYECYRGLFGDCINLRKITCYSPLGRECAFWHPRYFGTGFSKDGTFVKAKGAKWGIDSDMSGNNIPYGWSVVEVDVYIEAPMDDKQYARQNGAWTVVESGGSVTPEGKYMTITVDESNSGETTIHPNVTGSLPNLNLQYRINNGEWTDFIVGTTADIHVVAGDFVQWKGNNPDGVSMDDSNYLNFAISGNPVHLSGNVMSLIDGVGDELVIPNKGFCFYSLFKNSNVKTVSIDFLPATKLFNNCYWRMFEGCTSLVNAPELPSKNIYRFCYNNMFKGCTSLVNAPSLTATTIENSCYFGMFSGCTSLVKVPEILPADTLKDFCYSYMFEGCTSLVTAPSLPATTLAQDCYSSMFEGCTSLVTAPSLPATTLAQDCYSSMFMECSKLVQAPELPAPVLVSDCYWRIFYGCKKLKYIKSLAIEGIINDDGTESGSLFGWLDFTSNTGTFEKPAEAVYLTDSPGGIPSGWTVKEIYEYTEAPKDGQQYARQDGAWVEAEPSKVKTTNNTTMQFWSGTQQEYDAIATKDANTLYIIK